MSLTFTLRRVLPDPLPAAQPHQYFHQRTTVFPTRGGAPPSAVRDFPPNCGPGGGILELDPTSPPAAADGAGNEDLMSELKSDHGGHECEEEDIAHEFYEGLTSPPERDASDEYEEDFMSTGSKEYDADEHFEGLSSLPERDDADEFYDDMMHSLRRGDFAGDEYEDDLMSTGAREYDAYEHLEGLSSSSERDEAELIYDDMMRSLRRGDFAGGEYEEDSMTTPQSDEGLPDEVIATFLKTTADVGVCAVCLDDLYEKDRAIGVLDCRHGFHGDCIGDWLQKKNDCPLCRAIAIRIYMIF